MSECFLHNYSHRPATRVYSEVDWEEHWSHGGETQETQAGRGRKRGPLSPDRAGGIDSWTTGD